MATKPKADTAKTPALRASIYLVGVTANGNGIGPTRIPRADVIETVADAQRNGYHVITYVAPHAEKWDGDFLYTPDAASAVAIPREVRDAATAAVKAAP